MQWKNMKRKTSEKTKTKKKWKHLFIAHSKAKTYLKRIVHRFLAISFTFNHFSFQNHRKVFTTLNVDDEGEDEQFFTRKYTYILSVIITKSFPFLFITF